jgi:hypothetical protein
LYYNKNMGYILNKKSLKQWLTVYLGIFRSDLDWIIYSLYLVSNQLVAISMGNKWET